MVDMLTMRRWQGIFANGLRIRSGVSVKLDKTAVCLNFYGRYTNTGD